MAYLSHIVKQGSVKADPEKIAAMQTWPHLQTIKQLRAFLGLTGYYCGFVRGYASISALLTDLMRTNSFNWNPKVEAAFLCHKEMLSTTQVLRLPDFNCEFVVEADASKFGIRAIIVQSSQPITFLSKKLSPRMQVASTYTEELHAITEAVHKW